MNILDAYTVLHTFSENCMGRFDQLLYEVDGDGETRTAQDVKTELKFQIETMIMELNEIKSDLEKLSSKKFLEKNL